MYGVSFPRILIGHQTFLCMHPGMMHSFTCVPRSKQADLKRYFRREEEIKKEAAMRIQEWELRKGLQVSRDGWRRRTMTCPLIRGPHPPISPSSPLQVEMEVMQSLHDLQVQRVLDMKAKKK